MVNIIHSQSNVQTVINIYINCTQALNNRISLHKSNIKLLENRKFYISKHLYECI